MNIDQRIGQTILTIFLNHDTINLTETAQLKYYDKCIPYRRQITNDLSPFTLMKKVPCSRKQGYLFGDALEPPYSKADAEFLHSLETCSELQDSYASADLDAMHKLGYESVQVLGLHDYGG